MALAGRCVVAPAHSRLAVRARDRRALSVRAAAGVADLSPLPLTARDELAQAAASVSKAIKAGVARQRLELLLPTDQRKACFTNVDPLDYPVSALEVYSVAGECASVLLQLVSGKPVRLPEPSQGDCYASELDAVIKSRRIDDDGDPSGVFYLEDKSVAIVVLPTAERLKEIRAFAEDKQVQTLIIMNQQWNDEGQVISVFGIGPWKKAAEDFLSTFKLTYSLTEKRIGAASTLGAGGRNAGLGGVARILRAYPGRWQIFAMGGDGSSELATAVDEMPTYAVLEKIFTKVEFSLRASRKGTVSQEQALTDAAAAAGTGSITAADWSVRSVAEIQAAIKAKALKAGDVALLDKSALRAALGMFQLPTSGKLDDLRERLATALEEQASGKRDVA